MNKKILCLSAVYFKEMTGYEIKKHFEDGLSHITTVSYGSIYPSLKQLLNEGYVSCSTEQQESRPPKKVYSITNKGREYFIKELELIEQKHEVNSSFLFLTGHSNLLQKSHVLDILNKRIAKLQEYYDLIKVWVNKLADSKEPYSTFNLDYSFHMIDAELKFLKEKHRELESTAHSGSSSKD